MSQKFVKILLKRRPTQNSIEIDLNSIAPIIKQNDKEQLFQIFKDIVIQPIMHDVYWLRVIINSTPNEGLLITEMMKWFEVAKLVNDIDENEDIEISISSKDVDMIIERLRNKDFKVIKFSITFAQFLNDFQLQTGIQI